LYCIPVDAPRVTLLAVFPAYALEDCERAVDIE
jgi:hypothetical protein